MNLKENDELTLKDLAEFFQIKLPTLKNNKQKYLSKLEEFASFEVITSPAGYFKKVKIYDVYSDKPYYKVYKNDLITWLDAQGEKVFELAGEKGITNLTVLTNYYCKENNIPYDGPHYIQETLEGKTSNGKRKVVQAAKTPNPEFKTWHYLRWLIKDYLQKKNIKSNLSKPFDMKTGDFNPTYLYLMSEEDVKEYGRICFEVYGEGAVAHGVDISIFIEEMEVRDLSGEEVKKILLQQKEIKALTDSDKKTLFISKLQEAGLLKQKGWQWHEAK